MNAFCIMTPARVVLSGLYAVFLVGACASSSPAPQFEDARSIQDRVVSQERDDIRVSSSVPSREETREIFGEDLYKQKIQPVWLRIENDRDYSLTFMPVGLDPAYYSPLEAANIRLRNDKNVKPKSLVNQLFLDQSLSLTIQPGEELSGFIFTRLDEGTKTFNVDIVTPDDIETFTFFIQVPGLAIDHYTIDWDKLYPAERYVDFDDDQLLEAVEAFVCCVTDKSGQETGDPLNLVIIGEPLDLYVAFIRAGWDETEIVTSASAWKTFRSFVSGGEYRYSPISSLYVLDRPQDVAFQKARDNIHERNHLRLWMTPVRYRGQPVWMGQISRDIGVRFTRKTITTHKIDPDVDETREFLLEDLVYAQSVRAAGYLQGVGAVSREEPRGNLTGDPWFTDGYRLVLWVTREPYPVTDIEVLPWRNPYQDEKRKE